MRALFILAFGANLALAVLSLFLLPERTAIHFGAGGEANGWAPRHVHILLSVATSLLLFLLLYTVPLWTFKVPAKWINLPHKDYWLAEENRPRAQAILARLLYEFGAAIFLFLFVTGLLVLQANLAPPPRLNEPVLLGALALFLLYTVAWCVRLYRGFRMPAGGQ